MPLLQAGRKEFNCNAILLDKDGTLIDFKEMWLKWSSYVIDEILVEVKSGVLRGALEKAMGIDLERWYVNPQGSLAGGTMSGLRSALGDVLESAGMVENTAQELITEISQRSEGALDWESLTKPVSGLHRLLDHLKHNGFKLAVVTADITERAKISLTSLQLIDYFDAIIGADLVENTKPAPDMALMACHQLGVKPGQAVIIGDTPRDIYMAKSAGASSVGVLTGVCTKEQLADADTVINSVTELLYIK